MYTIEVNDIRTDVQPNQNTVILHSNYVEMIWDGAQNAEKVRKSNLEVIAAAEKIQATGMPILISVSIQNHPKLPDMGAFKEVLKLFDAIEASRLSISGAVPPMVLSLITTVIASFNKQLEIKYFRDQNAALDWLLQSNQTSE